MEDIEDEDPFAEQGPAKGGLAAKLAAFEAMHEED